MADRVLRDQCIHGRYEGHAVKATSAYGTTTVSCDGGREVTIDYSRVNARAWGLSKEDVEDIVDAALRETV